MQILGPSPDPHAGYETLLRSLPGWFGHEASLIEYAHNATTLSGFAAYSGEHLAGFVSLRQHFPQTWEIDCIAVLPDLHRKGFGRLLLACAEGWLREQGARFLQVKTLAESHPSPEYAATRAFYSHLGFLPLEEFPATLWGVGTPCLLMVKYLGG